MQGVMARLWSLVLAALDSRGSGVKARDRRGGAGMRALGV